MHRWVTYLWIHHPIALFRQPLSCITLGTCALVKRASDHCKGTMEIDSTGIIAFDSAKCEYGALERRGSQQGCDPVGAWWRKPLQVLSCQLSGSGLLVRLWPGWILQLAHISLVAHVQPDYNKKARYLPIWKNVHFISAVSPRLYKIHKNW